MITTLIVLTVIEIVALVLVLALMVASVIKKLRSVAKTLGTIAFGVRAVEIQVAALGPSVGRVNQIATRIADDALPAVAKLAERAASGKKR